MAPSPITLAILLSIIFDTTTSESIGCNGNCECLPNFPSNEVCTLSCGFQDSCKTSTLTCAANRPCIIQCNDISSCADLTQIHGSSATDVTVICKTIDSCKSQLTIICGTGDCNLQCNDPTACEDMIVPITTNAHSFKCTNCPTNIASLQFTTNPTIQPTLTPTITSSNPTITPTTFPTNTPTDTTTSNPTITPSNFPTNTPTDITTNPSIFPTKTPTNFPTISPTNFPSNFPTKTPSNFPTISPTNFPSNLPTKTPSNFPTISPTFVPTIEPTIEPTYIPTNEPTTLYPTTVPVPTHAPITIQPSVNPSGNPTLDPTIIPTDNPTMEPTTNIPTKFTTDLPSISSMVTEIVFSTSVTGSIPDVTETDVTETVGVVINETKDKNVYAIQNNEGKINVLIPVSIGVILLIGAIVFLIYWRKKKSVSDMDAIPNDDSENMVNILNASVGTGGKSNLKKGKKELLHSENDNSDGLIEITEVEGKLNVFYRLNFHYNDNSFEHILKGSELGGTKSGWNDKTFDELRDAIKEQFEIIHNNFQLYELAADDCPVDIDDIDDIIASFDDNNNNGKVIDIYVTSGNVNVKNEDEDEDQVALIDK